MEGKGRPEYEKCVAISTDASIKKMMAPGAIAIVSPIIIGFVLGPESLGGFLAGATVSGVLLGMFQNNAGGAWDNAKKSFEKGVEINGETYYKKSEPHKASVTGDTVGDPFKDTSGPSMNILIKLMSIVSLVIAPTLAQVHGTTSQKEETVSLSKEALLGTWSNNNQSGEMFIFSEEGKAQWVLPGENKPDTFEINYIFEPSVSPKHLDLYNFTSGQLNGNTLYGIAEFRDGSIKVDFEPGKDATARPAFFNEKDAQIYIKN